MKEPIEKIVKESLEQHEMPYNAAAWTSLQAKLDAKAASEVKNAERVVVPLKKAYIAANDKLASAKNQKMPLSAIKELTESVGK